MPRPPSTHLTLDRLTPGLLLLLAAACDEGGSGAGSPDAAPNGGPPLLIKTVDEEGRAVLAKRVLYQPVPSDPFWLEAKPAACASGGMPPCSEWVVAEAFAAPIVVSAERITEAPMTAACSPYASTFARVNPGTDERPAQVLHLTLPTFGTYCVDPETFRSSVNVQHAEILDERDWLVTPAPATGAVRVKVVDQDGKPAAGSIAHWYYTPDTSDYGGEKPLACVDLRCETWVMTDAPKPGTIYVNVSYAGPFNPFLMQGWTDYAAVPLTLTVDGSGQLIPQDVTLVVDTTLEGAIE